MDFDSTNPEMAMAIPMLQGSTMEMFFIPDFSRANVLMGSFMKMNTVIDVKAKKGLMLMEMMGNKIATPMDLAKPPLQEKPNYTVVKITPETKSILGFKCDKNILKSDDGTEITIWTTKELKGNFKGIEQLDQFPVDGFPMEFSMDTNGMNVHYIATQFDKEVPDSGFFSLEIPEGYTIMSEEDLAKMGN